MKKKSSSYILFILFGALVFASCKKDNYKNDGGQSSPNVNMTTYDFLKSNPLFDSLVRIIDRAGMKDAINGDITFFATTNYGSRDFVTARKVRNGVITGDENMPYTIDSLPVSEMKDSLKMYIYPGKINRGQMTTEGKLYDCALGPIPDIKFLIKLRRTRDFSDYLDHVDYVNFTKVVGTRDDQEPDPDAIPQDQKDSGYDVQTSGIITTTGIVHVLSGNHRLFFNTEPTN
jgi:hypothetical protein